MIALPIAIAAAIVAWGQPVLPPQLPPEPLAPAAAGETTETTEPAAPPLAVPMIARAPLNVRVLPVPSVTADAADAAPAKARRPLHKDWRFWAIAGSLFVATVATTYAVTRPEPLPYRGNIYPYVIAVP